MKIILTFFLVILIKFAFSQHDSSFYKYDSFPFINNEICNCTCGRTWMMAENKMDSLKQELLKFENKLGSESKDSIVDYSATWIKIYWAEYIVREEFDGKINKQFCVQRDSTELQLNYNPTINSKIEMFGNKYIKKTATCTYVGNATITTHYFEYYLRKE